MSKSTNAFDRATHKAFGYLLLFSVLFLPFGQHRLWMKQPGWWAYPVLFSLVLLGLWLHATGHGAGWRLLGLPWVGLFIIDALTLIAWPWPVAMPSNTTVKEPTP